MPEGTEREDEPRRFGERISGRGKILSFGKVDGAALKYFGRFSVSQLLSASL
jgi:hypothetical protein